MPRWRGLSEPLITPADWRVEKVAPEAAAMPLALVSSELPLLSIGVYGPPPVLKREKGGWYSKYPDPDPKNGGQQKRYDTYLERQAAEREYEKDPEHFESVEAQEEALARGDEERAAEKKYREQPIGSSVVDEVFAQIVTSAKPWGSIFQDFNNTDSGRYTFIGWSGSKYLMNTMTEEDRAAMGENPIAARVSFSRERADDLAPTCYIHQLKAVDWMLRVRNHEFEMNKWYLKEKLPVAPEYDPDNPPKKVKRPSDSAEVGGLKIEVQACDKGSPRRSHFQLAFFTKRRGPLVPEKRFAGLLLASTNVTFEHFQNYTPDSDVDVCAGETGLQWLFYDPSRDLNKNGSSAKDLASLHLEAYGYLFKEGLPRIINGLRVLNVSIKATMERHTDTETQHMLYDEWLRAFDGA